MRSIVIHALLAIMLCACFYPEVEEGGFDPLPDAGVAGSGGAGGSGGNVTAASWCPSSTFNVPCECQSSYTSAARACESLLQTASGTNEGSNISGCINSCYTNTACGTPYCDCVDLCQRTYGGRLTDAEQRATHDAYKCLLNALRDRCSSLPN